MAEDTQENADELPELEGVALEPQTAPAAPAAATTVSAKELTEDILGGVDFDLPAAPSAAAPKPAPVVKAPAAPGGFKPPAALFGQSGGFGASGLKPAAPLAAKPAAAPAVAAPAPVDTRAMLGDLGPDSKDALRAALTSDTPPAKIPLEITQALFHLARALIKKGIVTVDEIIPS